MKHPCLVRVGVVVMSTLLSHQIAAEEEVSLAFLEFLGGMVEADDEYITPLDLDEMDLDELESLSTQSESETSVDELDEERDKELSEVER